MITWTFDIDGVEVEEPKGFSEIVLNISRDEVWHGVFFEASTSTLSFYGTGADILRAARDANGLNAQATFNVTATCGEEVNVLSGSFDFGTYREKCGSDCNVEIAIEKSGCIMAMRNRYDQKVDLDKTTAFDNTTLLPDYAGLNINLELTAQGLFVGDEAALLEDQTKIVTDDDNWNPAAGGPFNSYYGYISPPLTEITNDSLGVFNTTPLIEVQYRQAGPVIVPPYPDFPTSVATATGTETIFNDDTCEVTDVTAEFRIVGEASTVQIGSLSAVACTLKLWKLPDGLDPNDFSNWVEEYSSGIIVARTTTGTTTFDTGNVVVPLSINQGDFFYWGIYTVGTRLADITSFSISFETGTYFKMLATSICPATFADVRMINETGNRLIQSITDGCLTFKSNYYGRSDSEPYPSAVDGCGSLRVLTNGLSVRKADPANHFISMQDFFSGLRGIDNIGMGIENNTELPGSNEWLRVEPMEYFYKNTQVLNLPFIPDAEMNLDSRLAYSKILIGYNSWEVERVNGLGEFNSNKEFRTNLKTIDNTLDAKSNFVAGGIPIEITRLQSFATSGAADTKYDNDTFIICVERGGYNYIVERGNIDNPANIFSPATVYNWRIRPMYNLMRWAKSILQSYINLANTTSKVLFSSGTGNYIAEGELPAGDYCKLESRVLPENNDLYKTDFAGTEYLPIYKPEIVTFEYPLSIADYLLLKTNPYGYINYQCGTGEYEKGFIKSVAYKPVDGTATFTLIKKWQ